MKNVVHLKNICSNKESKYVFEGSEPVLTYEKIIKIILLYQPTTSKDNISINYYDQRKKKWLFVYEDSVALIYSQEDEQVIDIMKNLYRQRSSSWQSIQLIPRILKIRYKIYNEPTLTPDLIFEVTDHLSKCKQLTDRFERKFDGDTVDINIFWGGPYFTRQHRQIKKGMQMYKDKYCLKYNVKYQEPISQILKTIKESNKRVHLKLNQFNEKSFESKNQFSIIYLICHTEEKEKSLVYHQQHNDQYNAPLMKMQSKSQQPQKQCQFEPPEFNTKNLSLNEDLKMKTPELSKRVLTSYPQKIKGQKKQHSNKKKQSGKNQKKIQKQIYFAGENKLGQLIKISPEMLEKMLDNKEVQLLILHTSFPLEHYSLLQKNPKLKNILLINSNPIYGSDSTILFLQIFFKNLLAGHNISSAYEIAFESTRTKYPKQLVCCCFHSHKPQCQFNKLCQINKYQGLHYRLHHIRCECIDAHLGNHYCSEKISNSKISYQKKSTQRYSRHRPLFYCCCLTSKEKMKHRIDNKFILYSQSNSNCQFQFKWGELKGDIDCMRGFQHKQKLIGNKKNIIKLMETFISVNNTKNCVIFNLYGIDSFSKFLLTDYFNDLMIRKKVFKQIETKQFKKFKDLQIAEDQNTLYYLIYKPKYNTMDEAQFERLSSLTNKNIKAILITKQPLKLSHLGIENEPEKMQPFNENDCKNYIKYETHMTQIMKDKVSKFFEMTWKRKWKQHYYPQKFDFEGILSTIAESAYRDQYDDYLTSLQLFPPNQLYIFFLFMGMAIQVPDQQSQGLKKYFSSQKLYTQEIHIQKPKQNYHSDKYKSSKQSRQKILERYNLLNISKSKIYFPLVYQKFCDKIQLFCLNLLQTYFYYISQLKKDYIQLYDATTDDPGSVINILSGKKIQQIKMQKKKIKNTHGQLDNYLTSIKTKYRLIASLTFVRNILESFYLFEIHDDQMKNEILECCLYIINAAIIFRKGFHDIKQEQAEFNSVQSITSIQMAKNTEFISKNIVQVRKNSKYSSDDDSDDSNHHHDLSLSNTQKIQQFSKFSLQNIKSEIPKQRSYGFIPLQQENIKPPKNSEQNRRGEKQFIIKHNLLNKKGLLFLLQKIIKKDNGKIKLLSYSLKLQILLQQIYESHHIARELLKNIDICIKQMRLIMSNISRNRNQYIYAIKRLEYDIGICLILKNTLGGRKKLSKQDVNEIQNYDDMANLTDHNYVDCFDKQYDQIILQLCEDKQVYNKITDKMIINQRYCSRQYQDKASCLLGQLKMYKKLIQAWQSYYKFLPGKNQNSSKDCYFAIVKLIDRFSSFDNIKSSTLLNFYNNLNQIAHISLNKLRTKMLVVLLANPIGKKKDNLDQKRFLVNLNDILQGKTKESYQSQSVYTRKDNLLGQSVVSIRESVYHSENFIQTDLDLQDDIMSFFTVQMKLNRRNIETLQNRKGCKYLAICVDVHPHNSKILIGQNENCELEQFQREDLAQLLLSIPYAHLFICLSKSSYLAKYLEQTKFRTNLEMVYFNIDSQNSPKLTPPQQRIIMMIITMKIIQRVEAGQTLEQALKIVKGNLQISESIYKQISLVPSQDHKNNSGHKGRIKNKQSHKEKSKNTTVNYDRETKWEKYKIIKLYPEEVDKITNYYHNFDEFQINNSSHLNDCSQASDVINCQFSPTIIITSQYLNAIETILYANNGSKSKNFNLCNLQQFKLHFKLYLKERVQCPNFFTLPANQKIFSQIVRKKLLNYYFSADKFVIMIQNYTDTHCETRINQQIQYFFAERQNVEIGGGVNNKIFKTFQHFTAIFQDKKPNLIILACKIKLVKV